MENTLYLIGMLAVMAVITAIAVPALFWRKCPGCGARNGIDAQACRKCGQKLEG